MSDLVVTGLPLSGLSVVSALVDGLPNAVCLNAPQHHLAQAHILPTRLDFCKWLTGDFAWTRLCITRQEPIKGFREQDIPPIRKPLAPDFILGMKHQALYTAILPELASFDYFTIIAVIRNPLEMIDIWQKNMDRPILSGILPMPDSYWTDFPRAADPLDRLVLLYDAHMKIYHQLRDHIHIVRYEDVRSDPMHLSTLLGRTQRSAHTSQIDTAPPMLMREEADKTIARFRKLSVFTKHFYDI